MCDHRRSKRASFIWPDNTFCGKPRCPDTPGRVQDVFRGCSLPRFGKQRSLSRVSAVCRSDQTLERFVSLLRQSFRDYLRVSSSWSGSWHKQRNQDENRLFTTRSQPQIIIPLALYDLSSPSDSSGSLARSLHSLAHSRGRACFQTAGSCE